MKPIQAVLAALAAVPMAAGCGAESVFFGDLGVSDGKAADMITLYALEAGKYKITDIRDKVDGCMIDSDPMDPILGASFDLTNDGAANIELKGWGKGKILFNEGTLVGSGMTSAGNCNYNWDVTVEVKVTDHNQFTGKYTENNTNRAAGCMPNVGMMCTTKWTMDLQKVTTSPDGG